jgi:RNA polymerase sigma factor for flagellar operon FliA
VQALWDEFHRHRSAKARNELVESYMPLVRLIARRIAGELPTSVQTDDLISVGTFGLMDAIDRYDPDQGARFETYCAVRIRGAMLDELRHLNWMSRLQSARATKVGAAAHSLKTSLGRTPTPQEIAEETGLKVREVEQAVGSRRRHVSLSDAPVGDSDGELRRIDILEAQDLCDPAALLQEKERRDLLAHEIRRLPRAQQRLVVLYYYDELTMKQIGDVLQVTESRVCQMHAGILDRLQQRLAEADASRARP